MLGEITAAILSYRIAKFPFLFFYCHASTPPVSSPPTNHGPAMPCRPLYSIFIWTRSTSLTRGTRRLERHAYGHTSTNQWTLTCRRARERTTATTRDPSDDHSDVSASHSDNSDSGSESGSHSDDGEATGTSEDAGSPRYFAYDVSPPLMTRRHRKHGASPSASSSTSLYRSRSRSGRHGGIEHTSDTPGDVTTPANGDVTTPAHGDVTTPLTTSVPPSLGS